MNKEFWDCFFNIEALEQLIKETYNSITFVMNKLCKNEKNKPKIWYKDIYEIFKKEYKFMCNISEEKFKKIFFNTIKKY